MVLSPLSWLTRFLSHRDLRKPDGRPLCSYRCTEEEFAELRNVLREACEGRPPVRRLPWDTHPLSCLYAAEWWRRHYSGGPWKWETVLEHGSVEWMPLSQLYYLVELGLRFWQRRLLTTGAGRAFLLTLACEGGLPLNLVHKEGANLRNFFKALLEEFKLYRRAGLSPEQLAETVRDRLPKSLRQPVVYTLSGQLVSTGILYRIAGEVCFRDTEDGRCVVSTQVPTETAWVYRLVGEILPYEADGIPVYLGLPRVWAYDAEDAPSEVFPHMLEWRPFSSRSRWFPPSRGVLGNVQLRHVIDGQLRFRTSLIILPADFQLKIHHGGSYREGTIELSGLGGADVGWRDVPGVTIRHDPSPASGVALLKCEANSEPPANLIFILRWNSGAQADLCVPFPARGGRFLDGDQRVLPNDSPVSLERLGCIRATAISTIPGERFSVSGKLAANDILTELLPAVWVHEPLRPIAPGRHEIPLRVTGARLPIRLFRSIDCRSSRRKRYCKWCSPSKHKARSTRPSCTWARFKDSVVRGCPLGSWRYEVQTCVSRECLEPVTPRRRCARCSAAPSACPSSLRDEKHKGNRWSRAW